MEHAKANELKHTSLYERHRALGAKFLPFEGWEMPISYESILKEHQTVRTAVGVFDVSHMGILVIEGPESGAFLDSLLPVQVAFKNKGEVFYAVLCRENGTAIDDCLIYKYSDTLFYLIANASNRNRVLKHLLKYIQNFNAQLFERFEGHGIIAVQGPFAKQSVAALFPKTELPGRMRVDTYSFQGQEVVISGTGYTGESGFELMGPNSAIEAMWDQLLQDGVKPIGLGARDTLRLEMGYALYGHELSDEIAPTESVARWSIALEKKNYLGCAALHALEPLRRFASGIILVERGVPREGNWLFDGDKQIGRLTSGGFSPSLEKGIGLALTDKKLKVGDLIEVEIRNKRVKAVVTALPFWHP